MKKLITILALSLAPALAFAHPGGNSLVCKSAKRSGSKQVVEFTLARSNGTGWYPPEFSVTVDGKKTEFKNDDETQSLGETIHNSPLGVILVTADNTGVENAPIYGQFQVTAVPSTVKAYDTDGKLVKWNFNAEKSECYDSNGKATFKGVFKGYIYENGRSEGQNLDVQVMDCELTYDSGMAC